MKKIIRIYLAIMFLSVLTASGQVQPLVSAEFRDASVQQLVSEIESQTSYHFFFDSAQMDSLRVNVTVKNETVESVLKKAFTNTPYKYAIVQSRVFLTKGRDIIASLPYGLFADERDETKATQVAQVALTDLSGIVEEEKVATLENKVIEVGIKTTPVKPGRVALSGYIRDSQNGTPVIGAAIYRDNPRIQTVTDQFGAFTLILPTGLNVLNIRAVGLKDTRRQVMLYSEGKLIIETASEVLSLKEVVIAAEKSANVRSTQLGVEKVSIQTVKQVPVVFGEADIMRVVLTLPGVKSVGEASNGFNVRGGAVDQNLILFDDLTIYNPSHFFGFFSAFNADVVKDVELYKSSIPAKFGGRLSSVLDVNSRDGNLKKVTGTAGLGLLTSRFNLEGPIVKDKSSFILGGRTTYSNWLLKMLPEKSGYKDSKASFYDLNLRISNKINDKNDVYFSGYRSSDESNLNSDTLYGYSNTNASLKWKHVFNSKLNAVAVGGYSKYGYKNYTEKNPINAYDLKFDIEQLNFKTDFTYFLTSKHTLDFGVNSIRYNLHPGNLQPKGSKSVINPNVIEAEHALESAIYLADRFDVTPDLSLNFGIRYSLFNYLGPQKIYSYPQGLPKTEANILDSTIYRQGKNIVNYHGPEYRLSARYAFSTDFSIKAGYNSLRQYIHMLSNTTAISPTDIWKLSDPNIRPQYGDQVSLGLYKNFKSNTIETSVEGYYKRLKDYLDYKSGATLILNSHIETDVINTRGKAYGVEFLIKKLTGKMNGWLSYTYSRTLLRMDDPTAGQLINGGNYYPSSYDKPHDFTAVGNFRFSHRVNLSLNLAYSTGRPITVPIGKYYYAGSLRALYSDRNEFRIPNYFRTDISMNFDGNHKVHQWTHSSWNVGVYNLTGRKNAYSTYYISEGGLIKGYKLTIFGSAVPFVNYNIKF